MAIDGSDNVVVSGKVWNDERGYDYETIKFSPSGTILWSQFLDGALQGEDPAALAIDSADSVVVTGTSSSAGKNDFLTAKYDAAGTLIWQVRTGPKKKNDNAVGVALDADGNAFVVGTSIEVEHVSDVLTAKISSDGIQRWTKTWTSQPRTTSPDSGMGVVTDAAGNVYVGASLRTNASGVGIIYGILKYSTTGTILTKKTYKIVPDGFAVPIQMTIDSAKTRVFMTGYAYNDVGASYDMFTVRM
jgi:hypothetical protein